MKGLLLPCLLVAVIQSPGGVDPQGLVGSWQGEGRYAEGDMDRTHGPVPFFLVVDASFHGEGTVGEARIRDWRLERKGRILHIEARLEGRVWMDSPSEKDHLSLVISGLGVNQFSAEFQLRGDEAFDPSPGEGRVIFRRVRPLNDPAKPGSPTTGPTPP